MKTKTRLIEQKTETNTSVRTKDRDIRRALTLIKPEKVENRSQCFFSSSTSLWMRQPIYFPAVQTCCNEIVSGNDVSQSALFRCGPFLEDVNNQPRGGRVSTRKTSRQYTRYLGAKQYIYLGHFRLHIQLEKTQTNKSFNLKNKIKRMERRVMRAQ